MIYNLNIDKKDAVFIGDSEVDVQTFKSADVDGIGVTWGFRPKSMLENAGCEHFAGTAEELLDTTEIIISLFSRYPSFSIRSIKSFSAPLTREGELRQKLEDLTGECYISVPNKYCPICGEQIKNEGVVNE